MSAVSEPAEWTFVVGRAFLAAVPIGTPPGTVAALGALVTEPQVELESVVALLPVLGDEAISSFVVIVPGNPKGDDGIPVSAVVRGAIAADLFSVGGSRRFTDQGIRPWLLADFQAVIGVVIGSPLVDSVPAARLDSGTPIGLGTVFGNTLFWSNEVPTGRDGDQGDTVLGAPASHTASDDTVLRKGARVDDTVMLPGRQRAATDAMGAPSETPGRETPASPRQAERPRRYGFRLFDEDRLLDGVYYLGRHPRSPRVIRAHGGDAGMPRLVTVVSRTSAVSGTHLEIRQEGDSVVVTDLGSTNGTFVTVPHSRRQRLRSGQSMAVMPGTTVDIGDGNIIEILPATAP